MPTGFLLTVDLGGSGLGNFALCTLSFQELEQIRIDTSSVEDEWQGIREVCTALHGEFTRFQTIPQLRTARLSKETT